MLLPDIVDVDAGNILYHPQEPGLSLLAQLQFKVDIGIEVIFNGPFSVTGDDQNFFDAALQGFFDDILDDRFINDGNHFLRDSLGHR